jgi:hypothetical protein
LLEADERSRQRTGSGPGPVTGGAAAGLDWPMHDGLAPPERNGPSDTSNAPGPRSSVEGRGPLSFFFSFFPLLYSIYLFFHRNTKPVQRL